MSDQALFDATMNVRMFLSGVVVLLVLTTLSCSAASAENDNEQADVVAKLTEHIRRLSDQLTQQAEQLTKLSDRQDKQAEQQAEQLTELSDRQDRQDKHAKQQAEQYELLYSKLSESSAGPTFVRWGKRTCNGTNSKIVYTGIAAGSDRTNVGGTSKLHCLPRDPTFGNFDDTFHGGHDVIIAEYKLDPNFPFENLEPLLNNDVPCAVCEVTNGSSVMMIPGRVDCYGDWRMEYRGYLMGEAWDIYRSEDICVDEHPEADYNGEEPSGWYVGLYPVESFCDASSLPCPPYGHRWELACVVCSK